MRKLILQEHVTIDNFAADLKGGMDFQEQYSAKKDESFIQGAEAFLDIVDTMLVGATTYNFFTEYLPESKKQADSFTDKIGSLSKYVVSTKLKEAPWGAWEPAEIIKSHVFEQINKLKEQRGKDIVIWGSMTLAHSLMQAGLIDEIQLRVIPTTLGKGKPVFDRTYDMELVDAKTYDKGLVLLRYTLKR
jgi:dihydrofolate reductase